MRRTLSLFASSSSGASPSSSLSVPLAATRRDWRDGANVVHPLGLHRCTRTSTTGARGARGRGATMTMGNVVNTTSTTMSMVRSLSSSSPATSSSSSSDNVLRGGGLASTCDPPYPEATNASSGSTAAPRASTNSSSTVAAALSEAYSLESVELIRKYGKKRPTSTSLETLMKTGRGELLSRYAPQNINDGTSTSSDEEGRVLMQVANFLRREIPVRLAHRIQGLSRVPYMRDMDSVKHVRDVYVDSLRQLASVPPIVTPDDETTFASDLERLYGNHSDVLIRMARGAFELRRTMAAREKEEGEFERMRECHMFLDRFYMSRIGIRVLAGQYLALRRDNDDRKSSSSSLGSGGDAIETTDDGDDRIGMIHRRTSPHDIVLRAAEDASVMCQRRYGDAPEVIVSGNLDLTFPYVPSHLHYILLELLKNAMRATMEKHGEDEDIDIDDFPPVRVVIADGQENEDVVIKVSDEGGGIPRSNISKIWSYLFTTADPKVQEGLLNDDNGRHEDHSVDSPLAGLGYGLPISRSYARYFGGDLDVCSMEGYGTDAFVYLRRLGDSKEPLPM